MADWQHGISVSGSSRNIWFADLTMSLMLMMPPRYGTTLCSTTRISTRMASTTSCLKAGSGTVLRRASQWRWNLIDLARGHLLGDGLVEDVLLHTETLAAE